MQTFRSRTERSRSFRVPIIPMAHAPKRGPHTQSRFQSNFCICTQSIWWMSCVPCKSSPCQILSLSTCGKAKLAAIRINLRSPCPTRDQRVGLLKGRVQEQLKRIGMFAAFVDATAIKSLRDFLQDLDQIIASSQCTSHQIDLVTDGFGGFDHTSAWNLPTADNHHPMHDHHANKFGVKVAEQVPRLLATGDIRLSVLFPQLEEQFNLPTST